jgi:D-arabinose 1-dehydrogenase-like Zn-dependent alcohol dehydrogenase
MMGFASNKACVDEKFIVPRRLAVGNFKLCGVLLSYVPEMMAAGMKEGMGWNFATTALGTKIQNEILALVRAKKIRAVVGKTVPFTEIPAAIEAMGKRQTTGRVIALL